MSRSMIPLLKWTAPRTCPAAHSLSSRVSTRTCGSPDSTIFLYPAISVCFTRDLASSTSLRNSGLCCIQLLPPPNLRAHPRQFRLDFLIAAVDVVHPVNYRVALRHQRSQHQ